tara:strand:- start:1110 stop:1319 length:210 start_codon:yes stop_codon:yes gene_type:complete
LGSIKNKSDQRRVTKGERERERRMVEEYREGVRMEGRWKGVRGGDTHLITLPTHCAAFLIASKVKKSPI